MPANKKNKNTLVRVKKVSAFPFAIEFKTQTVSVHAQVVKLSTQGFMMETTLSHLRPGDRIEFSFTLPVLNHMILSQGVVIKIYSQIVSGVPNAATANRPPASPNTDGGAHQNLVEIHFKNLSVEQKNYLYDFLKRLQSANAG